MEKASQYNWEFETITRHTLDILVIVDQYQIVKYVSPSFESILGYRTEEFLEKNAFAHLYPEDRDRLMASHREVILTQQPKVDEYRVFHKNGEVKYLESRVMPVPNHPEHLVVVSIRDITLRKQMEKELETRKNRYQELQNSLKNYSQDLSAVMKIADLKNRLMKELNTVIPSSQPILSVHNRDTDSVDGNISNGMDAFLQKVSVGRLHLDEDKIHILIGDRKEMAYILTINASSIEESMDSIWLETLVYYTVMVFESLNVIENLMNQLEQALRKSERPQWILRLLFNLSEKQRLELSSDLHDTVLQDQMALYRNLEGIIQGYEFNGEVQQQLQGIVQGLLDTIHQIRMTCNQLRPPLLREMGLVSALENLFEYTQVSSTFKIWFSAENLEGLDLNEEATIGIYRVVQELLNNAGKHSRAENLHVELRKREKELHLLYSDDGIGFDTGKLTPSFKSIGLSGMRERVQSLNGSIEFASQPGNGLKVKMQIPI